MTQHQPPTYNKLLTIPLVGQFVMWCGRGVAAFMYQTTENRIRFSRREIRSNIRSVYAIAETSLIHNENVLIC